LHNKTDKPEARLKQSLLNLKIMIAMENHKMVRVRKIMEHQAP